MLTSRDDPSTVLRDGLSFEMVMSIHRDTVVSLFIFMLLVCNHHVILKC